jgi:hypothetical protein
LVSSCKDIFKVLRGTNLWQASSYILCSYEKG